MQFITLIHTDEGPWEAFSDDERESVVRAVPRSSHATRRQQVYSRAVTSSRRRATRRRCASANDETLVTDGPYAEVKEALGGFFVLECDSMDEALDWAARIPAAEHGAIEVRPVYVDPEEVQL